MWYCSFEIGQFLKTKSERHAMGFLFKVQISPDHPTRNTNKSVIFTSISLFANFTALSMEFPHSRLFVIFLPNTREFFYQSILSHTLCRGPNKSLVKKIKCHLR